MLYLFLIYFVWILVLSLVTFAMFGWDKRQAGCGGRRVPESTLLGLSTVGGWPGGLWASYLFRHKTQKQPFRLWLCLGIMLHVVCVALIAYAILSRSASAAASVWTPAAGCHVPQAALLARTPSMPIPQSHHGNHPNRKSCKLT